MFHVAVCAGLGSLVGGHLFHMCLFVCFYIIFAVCWCFVWWCVLVGPAGLVD